MDDLDKPQPWKFGFTVKRAPIKEWYDSEKPLQVVGDGWRVYLPHQCEEWDIHHPYNYDAVLHGDAVAALERFIAEASEALEALRQGREFGDG